MDLRKVQRAHRGAVIPSPADVRRLGAVLRLPGEQNSALKVHQSCLNDQAVLARQLIAYLNEKGEPVMESRQISAYSTYLRLYKKAACSSDPEVRAQCIRLMDEAQKFLKLESEPARLEGLRQKKAAYDAIPIKEKISRHPLQYLAGSVVKFIDLCKNVARLKGLRTKLTRGIYQEPGGSYAMYLAKQVYKKQHPRRYACLQAVSVAGKMLRIGGALMFLTPIRELSLPVFFIGFAMIRTKQVLLDKRAFEVLCQFKGELEPMAKFAGLEDLLPEAGQPPFRSLEVTERGDLLSGLSAVSSILLRVAAMAMPFGIGAIVLGSVTAAKSFAVHGLMKSFAKQMDLKSYRIKIEREMLLRETIGCDVLALGDPLPFKALNP